MLCILLKYYIHLHVVANLEEILVDKFMVYLKIIIKI